MMSAASRYSSPFFESVDPLSDADLKAALETCASEPIHQPGAIQPHGMLIVMTRTGVILQVSANSECFLGRTPESLLGQPIADVIGRPQAARLNNTMLYGEREPVRSTIFEIATKDGLKHFDAVTHYSGNYLILELEANASAGSEFQFFYDELRDFSVTLRQADTLEPLYQHVVHSIRQISGFDRVMLYRFDDEWNGEVLAESREESINSYLGHHFPASDIPAQARALYAKNYLRLIADITYRPVPIVSQEDRSPPLDLSLSTLRSVSPVHVRYLSNMNVAASMSISIIQNDRLWGLVACHHRTPRHVPYRQRMVAELMGHIFSAQLSSFEEMQRLDQQKKREMLLEGLNATLEMQSQPEKLFEARYEAAFDALSAAGAAYTLDRNISTYGTTPTHDEISAILDWLKDHHPQQVFHSADLSKLWKGVPLLSELKGGMLATPIGRHAHNYVLWFRAGENRTIIWAGKPEKHIEPTEVGFRLTPRGSFATWQESVHGRAEPWRPEDISLAQAIITVLIESEKQAAQHASLAKSEFLANMSHELRTPMNAVIGLASILARSQPLTREQHEFISTLQLSSNALLALINDLLDIAKIESRNMTLESEPFNFCEIIEEVRSLMAVRAAEKRLHLNITYPKKQNCHFRGDPLRLRQILLNLVSNAIKFTEHGFVNVSMRVKPGENETKRLVQIDVSDTGIGMRDDQVTSIFDKFVQADSSISRRFGGTGLGLSISKHLVDAMGGSITVVSKEGMGSKFTLNLVLEAETVPQEAILCAADMSRPATPGDQRGKVLLTEDYEGNIMVALTYLQDLGYDVIVARNGKEALEKIEREAFDIVLMDVQMPVMDGYTATREIRRQSDIPIIGMTAHALTGDREKCIDAGMNDYISKPFTVEELQQKLERHIANTKNAI